MPRQAHPYSCPFTPDTPVTPTHRAFTLVELLVVIAIIALLVGILLPVLGSAKSSAKQMICASNQRQLMLAIQMYTQDYKQAYPQPAQDKHINEIQRYSCIWFNAVDHYLPLTQKKYSSNAAERNYEKYKQDPVWEEIAGSGNERRDTRTIKMNEFLGDINDENPRLLNEPASRVKFFKEHEIPRPANTVLFVDGRGRDTPSVTTGNVDVDEFSATEIYVGLRHDDGANVTFTDGHGQPIKQPIRQTNSGYRGWYGGTPATNGITIPGDASGPHSLIWRVGRY